LRLEPIAAHRVKTAGRLLFDQHARLNARSIGDKLRLLSHDKLSLRDETFAVMIDGQIGNTRKDRQ
jgi:hypothetical protein